jgi:predicted ATPase/class 3 adenylate cyclase
MADMTMASAPTGTVTVVLGDVAGSTRMWQADPHAMSQASGRMTQLTTAIAATHHGHLPREQGEGDNIVAAFTTASDAVAFAVEFDLALAQEPWPGELSLAMRIGIHTGDVEWSQANGYLGPTFNRCARIRDLGHARQILLSQASRDIVDDSLPAGLVLEDLGSHQLRDLSRSEQVFQLRHANDDNRQWAPLKSVSALPNNLPIPVTTLIGRDADIAHVGSLLVDHRLVTLTGSGGSGKTRLAQHVASEVLHLAPDGAWWVDLMPITEDERVVSTIAEAARFREVNTIDQLAASIADARMLLIVDNCEHVIDAVADTFEVLLRQCRNVRILATSRETVGIDGEQNVRVRPLGVPERGSVTRHDLDEHDATRLFLERALSVAPLDPTDDDADAIATICRRLDGIPLAIELAAARTRLLTPRQIAEGLDDRFQLLTSGARRARSRQRTLEASVAWSFDLLDDDEKAVLCRLGVLPAAFDLDAAQAIGGLGAPGAALLDILTSLVEKSLITVRPDPLGRRYRLLETIRQYALERLGERGEAQAARDAHLAHVIERMQILERHAVEPSSQAASALRQLKAWTYDIRAAQAWAVLRDRPQDIIELHFPNYYTASLLTTHPETLAALVPLLDDARLDDLARARVTAMVVPFRHSMNDFAGAASLARDGIALAREQGDVKSLLGLLIAGAASLGMDRGEGVELGLEAMDLARPLGPTLLATAGYSLGVALCFAQEPVDDHFHLLEEALHAARESGVHQLVVGTDGVISGHLTLKGDVAQGLERSRAGRAYALEHDPRSLSRWAILPGIWAGHWGGDTDFAPSLVQDSLRTAGPPGSMSHTFALLVRATENVLSGAPPADVLADTHVLIDRLRGSGAAHWLVCSFNLHAYALTHSGEHAAARATVDEARTLTPATGWWYARGGLCSAAAELIDADPVDTLAEIGDVLEMGLGMGWIVGWTPHLIAVAARSLHAIDRTEDAARILSLSDRAVDDAGVVNGNYTPGFHDQVRDAIRSSMTEPEFEAVTAAAQALSLVDALAIIRSHASPGADERPAAR